MHSAEIRTAVHNSQNGHYDSDTYGAAFRHAQDALGSQPVSEAALGKLESLSRELSAGLRDSSESLRDVRKICRRAVIDATRSHLRGEIDWLLLQLDELRLNSAAGDVEVDPIVLDRAMCTALKARVSLDTTPFRGTVHHLETTRVLLKSLGVSASRSDIGNATYVANSISHDSSINPEQQMDLTHLV